MRTPRCRVISSAPVGGQEPRATVILTGGYDGTAEELYFFNGAAALARGYHVLAFDGPGQGAALLQQGLVLRPDWENVVTPVLDYLLSRPGVDAGKIALIGLSLGGYLAPRAASAEHRLAACIADCGSYDLFDSALERIPGPLAAGLTEGRSAPTAVLRRILAPGAQAHRRVGVAARSACARCRGPRRLSPGPARLLTERPGRGDHLPGIRLPRRRR